MAVKTYEEIRGQIHASILSRINYAERIEDEAVMELIDEEISEAAFRESIPLSVRLRLRQDIFHAIRRLDVLQDLIDDPEVTEIMINGPDHIFIERGGRLEARRERFVSKEKLEAVTQQIVSDCNRSVNEASPIADARLPSGARVNVVLPPVALNGPILTIRRFPDTPITMEKLLSLSALSEEMALFLKDAVRAGYNIFISGGTGSGKTTFLNALSAFIPDGERLITIEDNAELQIQHVQNLVRLEARDGGIDGRREITIRELIRASLRMRPDRVVVGEVRGAEAIDMLQAMNTGHDGSMSTGHANSARDMLRRLETMVMMGMELPLPAVRAQIASGIDLIVHLTRLRDRSRKVAGIWEVTGMQEGDIALSQLYAFRETAEISGRIAGEWKCENRLSNTEKLQMAGLGTEPG